MTDEAKKTTGNATLEDAQVVLDAARTERALRVALLRVDRLERFMRTVADRVPTLAFEVTAALDFVDVVPLAVDSE